jgi:hypothetical protein
MGLKALITGLGVGGRKSKSKKEREKQKRKAKENVFIQEQVYKRKPCCI